MGRGVLEWGERSDCVPARVNFVLGCLEKKTKSVLQSRYEKKEANSTSGEFAGNALIESHGKLRKEQQQVRGLEKKKSRTRIPICCMLVYARAHPRVWLAPRGREAMHHENLSLGQTQDP